MKVSPGVAAARLAVARVLLTGVKPPRRLNWRRIAYASAPAGRARRVSAGTAL
ncbi:MAG: hypothetical protein M5U01_23745 [Ardenticatenaceae bacterium]|nr:hypothetical protein [Ardenticatenaceae bacterium]